MSNNKRIKFFSYYGCQDKDKLRTNSPAADSKIDYIIDALNRCGYAVDVISRAPSACNHFIKGYTKHHGQNTFRYFSSFGKTRRILRIFNYVFMNLLFFVWCLYHIKKNEQVIVYHSLGYDAMFLSLYRLKKLRIIGEIEEIYQDVHKQRKTVAMNEYKFIDICTKYIFPTSLLNDKVNKSDKPSIILHGLYSVENILEDKFKDGKIHVVYGGTLDPQKGGAAAAAAAAAFLPENYHIHICGFGDSSQIKAIVADVSTHSKAQVTFEGELKGDDYKHFIQKCHIGLSTQNPDAAFNSTSFPSKILVYLSNGLKVVTIRIPAIELSAVADYLYFYDEQSPQMIAKAIMQAADEKVDCRHGLKKLDELFINELKIFL